MPGRCQFAVTLPTKSYGRPVVVDPERPQSQRSGNDLPAAYEAWLAGVGGLIETRTTVWANEARQPEQAAMMPEPMTDAARFELDGAYRLAGAGLLLHTGRMARAQASKNASPSAPSPRRRLSGTPGSRPQPKQPPAESSPTPRSENFWELVAARCVLSFVPADSDLAQEARELLADPDAYVRERRQHALDDLQAAMGPGARYAGEWVRRVEFRSPMAKSTAPTALKRMDGTSGKLALVFDRRGANQHTVTGHLFDPANPKNSRQVTVEFSATPLDI